MNETQPKPSAEQLRVTAIVRSLEMQLASANQQVARASGDLAVAYAQIEQLQKRVDELEPKDQAA